VSNHHEQKSSPVPVFVHAGGPLRGRLTVPGDKSISHRALLFGALASGVTTISGLLEAEDVINTANAVTAMGARAEKTGDTWRVTGRGVGGLSEPAAPVDFGNSGTGTRLMLGVIAGHPMAVSLVGDASLSRRPMSRVLDPLRTMGLHVEGDGADTLPLSVRGTSELIPIEYELPVPSAQVKSAILIAGLHAAGTTTVIEREATRDHTERMLRYFGADVSVKEHDGLTRISVRGEGELSGRETIVPADPSSAAFIVAAAAITPGSDVTVTGVLTNPTRTGFYETLREMGANISFENELESGGELVADIHLRHAPLRGVEVPAARAPSMIDEYPVLACVAAHATGQTRMEGLAELKVKESDRLAATAAGLAANGITARIAGDTLTVVGRPGDVPGGGMVETHLDHRIAMAFLTLGLAAKAPVGVDDTRMIATSFPEFLGLMRELGARFEDSAEGAGV